MPLSRAKSAPPTRTAICLRLRRASSGRVESIVTHKHRAYSGNALKQVLLFAPQRRGAQGLIEVVVQAMKLLEQDQSEIAAQLALHHLGPRRPGGCARRLSSPSPGPCAMYHQRFLEFLATCSVRSRCAVRDECVRRTAASTRASRRLVLASCPNRIVRSHALAAG